jgi:hypothetical protein
MKTTEVHVTSESITDIEGQIDLSPLGGRDNRSHLRIPPDHPAYSVSVSSEQAHVFHTPISPTLSNTYDGKEATPTARLATSDEPHANTHANPMRRHATMEANNAAWSYTKVAVLFFTALLVTWIPSTANRVYSMIQTQQLSPQLQFASSFVLPLQGFWNGIIYATTSWGAVVAMLENAGWLRGRRTPTPNSGFTTAAGGATAAKGAYHLDRLPSSSGRKSPSSLSSTAGLASRPVTRGNYNEVAAA